MNDKDPIFLLLEKQKELKEQLKKLPIPDNIKEQLNRIIESKTQKMIEKEILKQLPKG